MRIHKKVWIWYGKGWAVQYLDTRDEVSLGVRLNWKHRLLDFYFGPLTVAFGKHPEITDTSEGQRRCCRGFFVAERALL